MYHPVLLPKRNKFGFLRGPKPSLNINESSTEKTSTSYEHLPKIKTNHNETNRYITNSIKPIRYKLNELNVSYELKTTSWQNNQDSYRLSSRKTTTTPPETAESWPPDLSSHLEQKQAYVPRRGSNVQNLKNHHFLNVISYHKNSNANNNVNNHYLNHHNCGKSSSNKCLVCRFVLADNSNNSNTNSGTNNTRRKLSNKTTMTKINKTSSNESTSNENNNFNISDLDDVNSSNNETSSVKKWSDEMAFNSKEKISYYQPNEGTNRPRIKLNLWL